MEGVWKSQWFKIVLISLGGSMMIISIYAYVTSSSIGNGFLFMMGMVILIFGILLYMYHHNDAIQNAVVNTVSAVNAKLQNNNLKDNMKKGGLFRYGE